MMQTDPDHAASLTGILAAESAMKCRPVGGSDIADTPKAAHVFRHPRRAPITRESRDAGQQGSLRTIALKVSATAPAPVA